MFKFFPIKKYLFVVNLTLVIFAILHFYLAFRRGYGDLYIANKAIAGAAFVLVGIVLLLGPLARLFNVFDRFLKYRKEMGMTAFVIGMLHSLISLFFLPSRFPLTYFLNNWIYFSFGLSSLLVLTYLFTISFRLVAAHLDPALWWKTQNWGVRVGGLLVLLHFAPAKYAAWVSWYSGSGGYSTARPDLPPASLWVAAFGLLVLLVRLLEKQPSVLARPLVAILLWLYPLFVLATLLR